MTAPIQVVLDTTAITAYAGASIAVGEAITMVGEEDAVVALPVACLAEAYRQVPDDQLPTVSLLAGHPSVVVVDTNPDDWLALAGLARDLGQVDAAAALLLAVDSDGYVLTAQPDAYGNPDELPVIPI
ncbi:hypothetical protein I0C86_39640 [Plantactinospora sp. S1510]|uniref:Twitching motility protein PilT n=1 Tax=Plantactinospora alkalitolerans TaxID=2789879 RepID=A0ABS0HA14_9ACTN|nr:hypothetical protein [Plantactinospora alkalitolerans]MBF9134994.1 hypothetical protein [Plantactinospora alkalitolerans]